MKTTIETTDIFTNTDNSRHVRLVCETLTDASQVYNVECILFDIRQAYTTTLENTDCADQHEATDKFTALVAALQGFKIT